PEQDLPGFLRFAGQPTGQRFRAVKQWLTGLCDLAHAWVKEGSASLAAATPMDGYVDAIFAFGLARLGEQDTARETLVRAKVSLAEHGEVHTFLFNAFEYRVKQALEGRAHAGPLPAEQVEYLSHMDRMARYVVDRLRQKSYILEPNSRIDP